MQKKAQKANNFLNAILGHMSYKCDLQSTCCKAIWLLVRQRENSIPVKMQISCSG